MALARSWCVVVVTTWAWGNGEGWAPPATSPAKWAMSTTKKAPTAIADGLGAETLEVPMARVGRSAGDDEFRFVLARQRLDLIHVDAMGGPNPDAIGDHVKPASGHVDRRPMRQVSTRGEIETHERVAGLHQGHEDSLVGLAAGIGLDVGEAAIEQLASALDGKAFGDVDELAAAIITSAGIAFRVLIGHH